MSPLPLLIGTSGFSYAHWKGAFYPPEVKPDGRLEYYVQRFDTVEINMTFYRSVSEETIDRWCMVTERDYPFTMKASKTITHIKRLKNTEASLSRMWHQFAPLGSRLSCVLFQLPPSLKIDLPRLDAFLHAVAQTRAEEVPRCRVAVEFRHRSWYEPEIFALLQEHDCAVVLHDMPYKGGFVPIERDGELLLKSGKLTITADDWWFRTRGTFVYMRFHGNVRNKAWNEYGDHLRAWLPVAEGGLRQETPFYAYFNNDGGGAAVRDAERFSKMLG